MYNFEIQFAYPWLLLIIIPAVILTLLPYLKLSKRHRRTRNRVTSVVLHICVMVFAILALSGMVFNYQIYNDQNSIILLVDVSDTTEEAAQKRDDFVDLVIRNSSFDNFNVGIVTFGYDQEYAVPLSRDFDDLYEDYLDSAKPDTSATNIAAALTFASDILENEANPKTSKIVLITDGKETDEEALNIIRGVISKGIMVDVAFVPSQYQEGEVQVTGVEFPDYHIMPGKDFTLKVSTISDFEVASTLNLYDNGQLVLTEAINISGGSAIQEHELTYNFSEEGLHEISVSISAVGDHMDINNDYLTYYNLEIYDKVLILEGIEGTSDKVITLLNEGNEYPYTIDVKYMGGTGLPQSADDFRDYDIVLLNNVSYEDMYSVNLQFDEWLQAYVSEYGGGLFTVGGKDEEGNAHAYNRKDMYGTVYQEMLPVQAIDYTPPIGVVFLIDCSGSMAGSGESSPLAHAIAGMSNSLAALSERDYVGIVTFDSSEAVVLEMTPRTHEAEIYSAINTLEANGGTEMTPGLETSYVLLNGLDNVAKRHIVVITDAALFDKEEDYLPLVESNSNSVTLSVICIGNIGETYREKMENLVKAGNGRLVESEYDDVTTKMYEELHVEAVKELNDTSFNPTIRDAFSPLVECLSTKENNPAEINITLGGFYGVKARENAEVILSADYGEPIYAQWKYGKGMVGSLMVDLVGDFSAELITNDEGITFVREVMNNLMPTENIRPNKLKVQVESDNYTNKLSIPVEIKEGETRRGTITPIINGEVGEAISLTEVKADATRDELQMLPCYPTMPLNATTNYSRCNFVIRQSGIYLIRIEQLDASGAVTETYEFYQSFAYSEEYDAFYEVDVSYTTDEDDEVQTANIPILTELVEKSRGNLIIDLSNDSAIFGDFVTDIDKTFDPRFLLMILSIVLFLLDIAVRKFKFKWPHELYRAYKEKKAEENK